MTPFTHNTVKPRRVVNLKALVIVSICAVVCRQSIAWMHSRQVGHTHQFLKTSAFAALENDRPNRAFELFEQCMAFDSDDDEVIENMAILLEDNGGTVDGLKNAFDINERLLLSYPDRNDLRLRQSRLASKLGRYSAAEAHLSILRETSPDLSEVWYLSGVAADHSGYRKKSLEFLGRCTTLPDPDPDAAARLANASFAQHRDLDQAEQILTEFVENNPSPGAFRVRARWYREHGISDKAVADLWRAVDGDSSDMQSVYMLLQSMTGLPQKQLHANQQRLVSHLTQTLQDNPQQSTLRLYLASALWSSGNRQQAIETVKAGVRRSPGQFQIHEVAVDYLISDGQIEEAQEIFDRIPGDALDHARRQFMRGRLLMAAEDYSDAIDAFEMAMGFTANVSLKSRAGLCLALCRRQSGNNPAAMESYRSVIQTNPDFDGGRLGLADSYLRSGQKDMAFAEYRQLLHVDGVPEFLADQLIEYNLELPERQRNWQEVRELLRDEDPVITDSVQRILLRADLMFAQGKPSEAYDYLDEARQMYPRRPEIVRSVKRLSTVHAERLKTQIRRTLKIDPTSMEAHLAMLRILVAQDDTPAIVLWLDHSIPASSLSRVESLRITAKSAAALADTLRPSGQEPLKELLIRRAGIAYQQLASESLDDLPEYIGFLSQHHSDDTVLAALRAIPDTVDAGLQAWCWLEALRNSSDRSGFRVPCGEHLIRLASRRPEDVTLRMAYAEYLIYFEAYTDALGVLQQVAEQGSNPIALSRAAWVTVVMGNDPDMSLQLSESAILLAPSHAEVRAVRGLSLALNGQLDSALSVFNAIPTENRSATSYLYEAMALARAGKSDKATHMIRILKRRGAARQMTPADMRMLESLMPADPASASRVESRDQSIPLNLRRSTGELSL